MDSGERDILIGLMADMIRQEVSDPMERLLDRLIALLLFSGAIQIDQLGEQMRQAFAELPEEERDTAGAQLLAKYGQLGTQPDGPPPAPDSAAMPAWFQGLIEGGKS
jgi:hypothetical protein